MLPAINLKKWHLLVVAAIALVVIVGAAYWAGDFFAGQTKLFQMTMPHLGVASLVIIIIGVGIALFIMAILKLSGNGFGEASVAARDANAGGQRLGLDNIESRTLRNIVLGAGVLVFLTFIWAGGFVGFKFESSEVSLPVVIIAGLVVLVMVLGLLTFVFSVLKLSDSKEALGLPSGSIRAVIALMLLVIFAIVAIFLYSDVSTSGRLAEIKGVQDARQELDLRKQLDVVFAWPQKDGKTEYPATIYYRSGSKAAEDLAKQLIVLLGTLVTAVSSFYFGSASIAAVTKAGGGGGPNAKAVSPTNLNPDGSSQSLTITGTNLNNVGAVKLIFDTKPPISASAVVAGEASISCRVTIPAGTEYGPWNVVVSDNTNNDSTVPNSVTIGTKPPVTGASGTDAQAKPQITRIDAADLKGDNKEHSIKIVGSNLTGVQSVKFDPPAGITVGTATPNTKGDELTVVVTAAAAQQPGPKVSVVTKVGESNTVQVEIRPA